MIEIQPLIDMGCISALYFVVAYMFAEVLDVCFDKIFPENTQFGKSFLECTVEIGVVGVVAYVSRGVVRLIHYKKSTEFKRLVEVYGDLLMMALLILLSRNITKKVIFLRGI